VKSRPVGGHKAWLSAAIHGWRSAALLRVYRCSLDTPDAGRAEGMIANPRFDADGFCAPADDAVGALLEEGIGGKLAGLAAGVAEEIATDDIGDVDRFDIIVQTLINAMMTGTSCSFSLDLLIHDRADSAARVGKRSK
jgi:hypothetical protein